MGRVPETNISQHCIREVASKAVRIALAPQKNKRLEGDKPSLTVKDQNRRKIAEGPKQVVKNTRTEEINNEQKNDCIELYKDEPPHIVFNDITREPVAIALQKEGNRYMVFEDESESRSLKAKVLKNGGKIIKDMDKVSGGSVLFELKHNLILNGYPPKIRKFAKQLMSKLGNYVAEFIE